MLTAIKNRRSIRKYKNMPVSKSVIEEIIDAGRLAPSSKNRQPWKFVILTDHAKKDMITVMRKGLFREEKTPLLPESVRFQEGAKHTIEIMEQAPVIILIINLLGTDIRDCLDPEERVYEMCNAYSIGAAIENMTLTAAELGLGSLWICDTYFAYDELKAWLNVEGELAAAMAVGYADEQPPARPRKRMDAVVEWRSFCGTQDQSRRLLCPGELSYEKRR